MDVNTFADDLLHALVDVAVFERIALHTEGPVANGYAYLEENVFLRFYFNEMTGTIAFALIEHQQRTWGIDYDNRRGWHEHPSDRPENHIAIEPLTIAEIVARLKNVLKKNSE